MLVNQIKTSCSFETVSLEINENWNWGKSKKGQPDQIVVEWKLQGIKKDETHQIVFIRSLIGKTRCVPDRAFLPPNCIILRLDMPFCINTSFHFVVNYQKCNLYEMDVGSPELYLLNEFPKVTLIFERGCPVCVCVLVLPHWLLGISTLLLPTHSSLESLNDARSPVGLRDGGRCFLFDDC